MYTPINRDMFIYPSYRHVVIPRLNLKIGMKTPCTIFLDGHMLKNHM